MTFGVEEAVSIHQAHVFEIDENAYFASPGGFKDSAQQLFQTEFRKDAFLRMQNNFVFE